MGVAFRTDSATVTVGEQEQIEQDLQIGCFEWTCGVIEGTVTELVDTTAVPVSGALVKAVDTTDPENVFLGITNDDGFYAICVPPGTYNVFVLCCGEDCFTDTTCECDPPG
jgi:hypothetical protein